MLLNTALPEQASHTATVSQYEEMFVQYRTCTILRQLQICIIASVLISGDNYDFEIFQDVLIKFFFLLQWVMLGWGTGGST